VPSWCNATVTTTTTTTTAETVIIIIIIIINYTPTYVRKQVYNWTKNTGTNMYQNLWKQARDAT
jgi:hypothetical protein